MTTQLSCLIGQKPHGANEHYSYEHHTVVCDDCTPDDYPMHSDPIACPHCDSGLNVSVGSYCTECTCTCGGRMEADGFCDDDSHREPAGPCISCGVQPEHINGVCNDCLWASVDDEDDDHLIETYCRHCHTTSAPGKAGTCCDKAVVPNNTRRPIILEGATIDWCEQHFFEELFTSTPCRNRGCRFYESEEAAHRRHITAQADVARGLPYNY